jgi:hypothetical protein
VVVDCAVSVQDRAAPSSMHPYVVIIVYMSVSMLTINVYAFDDAVVDLLLLCLSDRSQCVRCMSSMATGILGKDAHH